MNGVLTFVPSPMTQNCVGNFWSFLDISSSPAEWCGFKEVKEKGSGSREIIHLFLNPLCLMRNLLT